MSERESALLQIEGQIATITLSQPEKHNAFDDQVISCLRHYLGQIKSNPSIRAVVLQAEGKNFCAGADLAWMKRMASMSYEENLEDARALAALMLELDSLPIPTVARIQGAAFGGAIGLIACCDIAIAEEKARFCLSEAKLGLAPATIGPYVVTAMGSRTCRRLFATAEVFGAAQAKNFGLVHETASAEQLDEKINEFLSGILQTGPEAAIACKQLIKDIEQSPSDIIERTSQLIAELRVSEQGQEGLSAFFDKRPPSWRNG